MKKIMVGMELLKKAPISNLLYHQQRTVEALRAVSVVFNTYPTGSGKTRAAFERFKEINDNALIIAPTNEILVQHYNDAIEFVKGNNLKFRVVRIDAKIISKIKKEHPNRRGKILFNILENPSEYKNELNIVGESGRLIVIINPDIFYYCLYGLYGNLDKGNLMEVFIKKFNYIIIDEFHYYNSKQLVNFLYFMALSKHFGYMESKRKICILTATPDKLVEKYFKRIGLDFKVLSMDNEKEDTKNYEKLNTLSKMDLYITDNPLEDIVLDYYKENSLEEDSVVISNSLFKIHKIKQSLYKLKINKNNIGLITGVIESNERKEAVDKKIILATTTVDIGYNFAKKGKESQNIDTVLIEATTYDEAIQRIGRAGRILGKKNQDKRCKVIMSVSSEVYDNFSIIENEITRKELKNIIQKAMPENTLLKRYIKSGAILEIMNPLSDLYYKFPKKNTNMLDRDTIIAGLYNELNNIFADGKGKSFKTMLNETRDYKNYKKFIFEYHKYATQKEKIEFILNDYNDGFKNKGILNADLFVNVLNVLDLDEPIEKGDLEDFTLEEIDQIKVDYIDEILDYMEKSICIRNAIMNFRGQRPDINILIYDKFNTFTQCKKIFNYDIFHVLRYYDIYFYNTKNEFLIDLEKNNILINKEEIFNKEKFYVRINGIKEGITKLEYNYKYDGLREEFEKFYGDKVEAIKDLELSAKEKVKANWETRTLKNDIREYFKKSYMPIFVLVDDKIKSQIRRIIKNKLIIIEKLNVRCIDGTEKSYDVLLGSNANLVDYEILRLKDKTEKSEAFIF